METATVTAVYTVAGIAIGGAITAPCPPCAVPLFVAGVGLGAYAGYGTITAAQDAFSEGDWVTGTKRLIDTVDIAVGFIGGHRALKSLAAPRKAAATRRLLDDAARFEHLARQATKNPGSKKLVLGESMQNGISYTKGAAHYRASYFKLEKWYNVSKTLKRGNTLRDSELWKINEAFLRQQIKEGKQIILSHNPSNATGFFKLEVDFLKGLGYRFKKDGWVWKAILE